LPAFGERQPVPHSPGNTVMPQAIATKCKGQQCVSKLIVFASSDTEQRYTVKL